jgi:hypothetical protein
VKFEFLLHRVDALPSRFALAGHDEVDGARDGIEVP